MNEPRHNGLMAAHGSTESMGRALPQRISKIPGWQSSEAHRNMRVKPDADRKHARLRNMVHTLKVARK